MTNNDFISAAELRQVTENLSENIADEEVGDGRIALRGIRQDASARVLTAKELGEAFVKSDS